MALQDLQDAGPRSPRRPGLLDPEEGKDSSSKSSHSASLERGAGSQHDSFLDVRPCLLPSCCRACSASPGLPARHCSCCHTVTLAPPWHSNPGARRWHCSGWPRELGTQSWFSGRSGSWEGSVLGAAPLPSPAFCPDPSIPLQEDVPQQDTSSLSGWAF